MMNLSGANGIGGATPNITAHSSPSAATAGPAAAMNQTTPVQPSEPPSAESETSVEKASVKKRDEPVVNHTIVRQLVELSGNPQANIRNAKEIRKAYTPPINPYPSVYELAVVRKAEALESRARAELQNTEMEPEVDQQA